MVTCIKLVAEDTVGNGQILDNTGNMEQTVFAEELDAGYRERMIPIFLA